MAKRITILHILGVLSIIAAVVIAFATRGYFFIASLSLIGFAIILLLINWVTSKITNPKVRSLSRWITAFAYFSFFVITWINWYKYNAIIIPNNYNGTVTIIFGLEGYPKLPASGILKQEILIPETGILITSTKQDEIPNNYRQYFANGERVILDYESRMVMNDYSCILRNQYIRYYSFSFSNQLDPSHQELMTSLCDSINTGSLKSRYYSE